MADSSETLQNHGRSALELWTRAAPFQAGSALDESHALEVTIAIRPALMAEDWPTCR